MIPRPSSAQAITEAFKVHDAVAILGPRQCGKTTLARSLGASETPVHFFDLESRLDQRRLESPERTLGELTGLVVIDEIQRRPELFEVLRVLLDRPEKPARFMILGSASPDLIRGASESLAGRIGFVDLGGFELSDVGHNNLNELWARGGFPRSFLVDEDRLSYHWREAFIRTFLERDIPNLGIRVPPETLGRFWMMVAHYHGQVWNSAEFARSIGSGETTARRYLDILAGAYMVRVLPPWHENLKKRQVKAPKIYIRDSGLLHSLLDIPDRQILTGHPKFGASWEGFALEQILARSGTRRAFFWATHGGAELDLMLEAKGKRYGFEFKVNEAPGPTRSSTMAMNDLGLESVTFVYPGKTTYEIDEHRRVWPLKETLAWVGEHLSR